MAAGQGFKTFATGDVLSASDVNGYLMQGVLVFADATERNAEITSPQEGQFAYLKDTNVTTYYTGSAWANLDTTGMTNPMTTTGDTIYSSSGSTPARLGIGSTGQVLTVASGVPSWATPASTTPTFVGASAYRTFGQTISNSTETALQFDAELYDTNSFHDNSTNNTRMTVPAGKAGKYLITANTLFTNNSTGQRIVYLYVNSTAIQFSVAIGGSATIDLTVSTSYVANLAVGDIVEVRAFQNTGGSLVILGNENRSGFQVSYLGA